MSPTAAALAAHTALSCATVPALRRREARASLVLTPEQTRAGDLALFDAAHPVSDEARRVRLKAPFPDRPDVLLARPAAAALERAVAELGLQGRVSAASGYRTLAEQERLRSQAGDVDRVAVPGTSEHEAGLAVDLCRRRLVGGGVKLGFPRRGACQRLREALPGYGFVERYPQGREAVTGMPAEPWHFRYVGAPHAQAMARLGLTLEEWIALLEREAPLERPLAVSADGSVEPCPRHRAPAGSVLVAHVPVAGPFAVVLPHAQGAAFAQVSGTNRGGVIVTWPA